MEKKVNEINQTVDKNKSNDFIGLGKDLHGLIMGNLSIPDRQNLARTCRFFWNTSKELFWELQKEAGFNYLADVIRSNPILRKYSFGYKHLSALSVIVKTQLISTFRTDPDCAWKIASICGLEEHIIQQCLGDLDIRSFRDTNGRGVMYYYALGGQLERLKRFIDTHYPNFKLEKDDLDSMLSMAAAGGGSITVLTYLRDTLGYSLDKIYTFEDGSKGTLLTCAVTSGDQATVEFVEQSGADPAVGPNLTVLASNMGHWAIYDYYRAKEDPFADKTRAKEFAEMITCNALRTGNTLVASTVSRQFNVEFQAMKEVVLLGGNRSTFWWFVHNGWLSLQDTFGNDASTVQHLLAQYGHLDLLKEVLKHPKSVKTEVRVLDKKGQEVKKMRAFAVKDRFGRSLLHYAAAGGQTKTYDFLLPIFCQHQSLLPKLYTGGAPALPIDDLGRTVAHSAAAAESIWFLMHLYQSEGGVELVHQLDNSGASPLHEAAASPYAKPNILLWMIENLHFDVLATTTKGQTIVHLLAESAISERNMNNWDAVEAIVEKYPEAELLDKEALDGSTFRSMIAEENCKETLPILLRQKLESGPTIKR
jgi:hypothetical protein